LHLFDVFYKIKIVTNQIKKKPWNRVDLPVYSISSKGNEYDNMNIITYASAVSMKPKRFICAVYKNTKTLENVRLNGQFVLQILSDNQFALVRLLGKQTGYKINKIERLNKRNLLSEWNGFSILKEALAVMDMKIINEIDGGDHVCFLCDVAAYKNLNEGNELTLNILSDKKIISI
jgi:flavin reductase (DIM6/NTAB) family NADH-FMN oxidoreductase RutF